MAHHAKNSKPHPLLVIPALALYVVGVWLTWRDLKERDDDEVRGGKTVWRMASALNVSGSIAYWIFGRRMADR